MRDAKVRLSRLIELAGESTPEKQRALAFELYDLLTDWPARYPLGMRDPFEALLEKVLKRVDGTTRRMLAGRLASHPATAVSLLNEFYFDVPLEAKAAILRRNAALDEPGQSTEAHTSEAALLEAARQLRGNDFAAAFGAFLGVTTTTAVRILGDVSGHGLAVACKGASVKRATYSALALLAISELRVNPGARFDHLAGFEQVPLEGTRRLLAHWQKQKQEAQNDLRGAAAA